MNTRLRAMLCTSFLPIAVAMAQPQQSVNPKPADNSTSQPDGKAEKSHSAQKAAGLCTHPLGHLHHMHGACSGGNDHKCELNFTNDIKNGNANGHEQDRDCVIRVSVTDQDTVHITDTTAFSVKLVPDDNNPDACKQRSNSLLSKTYSGKDVTIGPIDVSLRGCVVHLTDASGSGDPHIFVDY